MFKFNFGTGTIGEIEGPFNLVTGDERRNILWGTNRQDKILGFGGNDYLFGSGNDDQIMGGDGNDVLVGGEGYDTLDGGSGRDKLLESGDKDFILWNTSIYYNTYDSNLLKSIETVELTGGESSNLMSAYDFTRGTVILRGRGGDDKIFGGTKNDFLYGGSGDDEILGGKGDDHIEGGTGTDTLSGDRGNDTLIGNDEWKRLDGGRGDDLLVAGGGSTMIGGPGEDEFVLDPSLGIGFIDDFVSGKDSIKILHDDPLPIRFGLEEGTTATRGNTRFLYDRGAGYQGRLYFDQDGSGTEAPVLIAYLEGAPTLETSDLGSTSSF